MTFGDYSAFTPMTWYRGEDDSFVAFMQAVLGLSGEAGEITELMKKYLRGDRGEPNTETLEFPPNLKALILRELGDLLYYIDTVARLLGEDLETVAQGNISKLNARMGKNLIQGDGSDR